MRDSGYRHRGIVYPYAEGLPFVVYGVESPAYPDWMFGFIPAKKDYFTFNGSVIILAAGYLSSDTNSDGTPIVSSAHLIRDLPIGEQFAERVVRALVSPDERVTFMRSGNTPLLDPRWVESIRQAGFEIIETENDVVCIGTGESLASVEWLQGVYDRDDARLIASHHPMSKLETLLVEGARNGDDLRKIIQKFYYDVFWHPQKAVDELNPYSLIAGPTGLRGEYFAINRADTDISQLESILIGIAADLGVALYYLGDIKQSSATGDPFGIERRDSGLLASMVKVHPLQES